MRYLIYLALLAPITLNAGAIHKWVDEDGNVHYGDAPPVSTKTENVRVQPAPKNPGKALPRLSTPKQETAAGDDSTTTANNQDDVTDEQAKIACEYAQEDLRVIKNSSRIKLKNSDGSTRYMTPEEIEERKAQAEADIAKHCR